MISKIIAEVAIIYDQLVGRYVCSCSNCNKDSYLAKGAQNLVCEPPFFLFRVLFFSAILRSCNFYFSVSSFPQFSSCSLDFRVCVWSSCWCGYISTFFASVILL